MKKLLIFLSVLLFAVSVPSAHGAQIECRVLSVGQGDSIFFRLPSGETILIDGGTQDAAPLVVKSLNNLGVKKIDLLIATHPHEDHIGGLLSVLDSFGVEEVWDSGYNLGTSAQIKFLQKIQDKKLRFKVVKAGDFLNIGEVNIEVLAPVNSPAIKNEPNNNCVIVYISWKKMSFLMMGDAEQKERKKIAKFPHAVVLKLSHHGSRNGTDARLLRDVKPLAAVASFGKNNPYHHPHRETLELVQKSGAKFYSTLDGDVVIESDGENFSVRNEKPKNDGDFLDYLKTFFGW